MKACHVLLLCLGGANLPAAEYRLSGPHTHQQATVYLVHLVRPPQAAAGKSYLPLKQALAQRKVVVYETGNVNELAIENLSADADVFIQGGDIVKGGQQDRVFATDLILPPKSGKTRIESFCVEQGRWSRRGAEDFRTFSASANMVVSNDVKLAIKGSKNQGEVWNSVARLREKLAPRVSMARGVAAASPTSMQLYLEDGAVNKGADEHAASLLKAGEGAPDAVGYVFALNGKILSADIYASPALFRELWPKHAQALAIEALAEQDKSGASVRLTSEAALAFLYGAESGGTTSSPAPAAPNSRTRVVKKDSAKALYLESHDNASKGWIHRSYTAK